MAMTTYELLAVSIPGFISLLSIAYIWGFRLAEVKSQLSYMAPLQKLVHDLELKMARVEAQIGPFLRVVETELASMLKHPDSQEFDDLLDALPSLDPKKDHDRLERLKCLLVDQFQANKKTNGCCAVNIALVLARVEGKLHEG